MSLAAEVLKPLALSVLLAFALTPVAKFLEKRRVPRGLAVLLTLFLTLASVAGIGFVVGEQMTHLAGDLPKYRDTIQHKIDAVLKPGQESFMTRGKKVFDQVANTLEPAASAKGKGASEEDVDRIQNVRLVQEPPFREQVQALAGPYLEFLGVGSFVLVLVLFMMLGREDLRDRTLQLFGHSHISLTTRTMDEIGKRISRYLATFALVNASYGLVIGFGLWMIGLPLAVLWGCIAALTRFIPYVGPAVAFALPLLFSFATSPGWMQPLYVFLLFAVVETALNSYLEPVIYGKTTGVTALGLLVAAMFWTWLWGLMGLLLSTPLTVCLAVLGKYVPSLSVFSVLLGEEAELDPDVRFYQRLVALDRDGAVEVIEGEVAKHSKAEVFDTILVPVLARAERDAAEGYLDDQDLAFISRVVEETVEDIDGHLEEATGLPGKPTAPALVLGVASNDSSDTVVLKMLGQLLAPSGVTLELECESTTPLNLAERVERIAPSLVIFSSLSANALTSTRYQVRRLRSRFAEMPIMVGRWGATGKAATDSQALTNGVGASSVVLTLAEARDKVVSTLVAPKAEPGFREFLTPPSSTAAEADLAKVGS